MSGECSCPACQPQTLASSSACSLPTLRMIGGVLMGLLFGKIGYYLVLGWCCVSIFVFMVSGARAAKTDYRPPGQTRGGGTGESLEHPRTENLDQCHSVELEGLRVPQTWGLGALLEGERVSCVGPLRRARTSQEVGGQGCPVQRLFLVYSLGFLPTCPWRKAESFQC